MTNFWQRLPKPFTVLAPMDGVTDVAFREVLFRAARPDVFFTEFTSSEGLLSRGRERLLRNFVFNKAEHPIVAQIWGSTPAAFTEAARTVKDLGFDGVDINMGCPVRGVIAHHSCSYLITDEKLTADIVAATKEGAGDMPVSVKTRIGFNKIDTERWFSFLLGQNLAAITVHGRVASQLSKYPANWEEIGKVAKLRDELSLSTIIVGNGDVKSYADVVKRSEETGVDGVMIGRGVFENLWCFEKPLDSVEHTEGEKIEMFRYHIANYQEYFGETRDFNMLKKFTKVYINGFPGASELRQKLMETQSLAELTEILRKA
ncbi:MAG: tRNA-dihydrouridine synthase [candidate division WWE3 bacterium]|nr:tRNA-dihydrouridine synthase [candidate division WWE3 bacterium]